MLEVVFLCILPSPHGGIAGAQVDIRGDSVCKINIIRVNGNEHVSTLLNFNIVIKGGFTMKKIVIALVLALALIGTVAPSFAAGTPNNNVGHQAVMTSASLMNTIMTGFATPAWATDPFASTAVANAPATLGAVATGKLGKAVFFFALFVGIMCILFTKHRIFGLLVLIFGFMLGAYSGIAQGLWTAVGGQ